MAKKKFVYISSPYTLGDNFVNVNRQIQTGNELIDLGFIPLSPLLNSVWYHMQKERAWDIWMDIDYALLDKCDILLRLPGESKGADLEVTYAQEQGIPVHFNIDSLRYLYSGE